MIRQGNFPEYRKLSGYEGPGIKHVEKYVDIQGIEMEVILDIKIVLDIEVKHHKL